ncbi:hypothetical protein [Azospirillum soli]|uniref:hypothetical protein n=1 Tax=Azospirillum soli TaxID=1304799 RepID=UPI001AE38A1D|nr:hypothetical protein [Azospirillum soli]MBP2316868.1 hypothetical protein [Azospirillum soli]
MGHLVQHPTVKPTSLTEYYARHILPPAGIGHPRRLLVPFAGSGSEMVGAIRAEWEEVDGIERETPYSTIADTRCRNAEAHVAAQKAKQAPVADLFNVAAE